MKSVHIFGLTYLFSLLISFPAQAAPIGESAGEIWIDGPAEVQPGSDPGNPDVVIDESGRSIWVWDGTPASAKKEVFLRIYPADGGPPTDPVQVNTFDDDNQHFPRVAVSGDGSFLVVWLSKEIFNPPNTATRNIIRSQAFDADANPVGDEQILSTLKPGLTAFDKVDVAALPGGDYIVVWKSSQTFVDPEDNGHTIQGRKIGADGNPLAEQFQINSRITRENERDPAVTELADGGFLVVWTTPQVHGRRFNADFTAAGDDFQINVADEFIAGTEVDTDVVVHEDGQVLVVWTDPEDKSNVTEIRGRLFSQNLVAQGQDFRINTLTTGAQAVPRAADYGQGGFFVVWQSAASAGDDNDPPGIEGRIVTGSNQFAGPEFQLNDWISQKQQFPGIGGRNGRVSVGWDSATNVDDSKSVIYGQFWSICGIFCDGFE
jgi:hypothetical protein